MKSDTTLGLVALALVFAAALPAVAGEDDDGTKFTGFLCHIDLPPFSQTTDGSEVGTWDSQLTCEDEDDDEDEDKEVHLKCRTTLSKTTLNALGITKKKTKTYKKFPCRIDASRCGLGVKLSKNSQLIIKGSNGEAKLECEW